MGVEVRVLRPVEMGVIAPGSEQPQANRQGRRAGERRRGRGGLLRSYKGVGQASNASHPDMASMLTHDSIGDSISPLCVQRHRHRALSTLPHRAS